MMGKEFYKYSVYDVVTDKVVLRWVSMKEVIATTGIPKDKITEYASKGYVYSGKYRLSRRAINEVEMNDCDDSTYIPQTLLNEWDRVRLLINPKARVVK